MIKKSLRCCISCILPCGALDVVRIVHSNGRVEELTRTVRAADVMRAHPKHILKKPSSRACYSSESDVVSPSGPTIVVVPPDAELQRGKIYFLIPVAKSASRNDDVEKRRKKRSASVEGSGRGVNKGMEVRANLVLDQDQDKYLSEIIREKTGQGRERRRGRVGIWRPHLESISENILSNCNDQSSVTSSSCD